MQAVSMQKEHNSLGVLLNRGNNPLTSDSREGSPLCRTSWVIPLERPGVPGPKSWTRWSENSRAFLRPDQDQNVQEASGEVPVKKVQSYFEVQARCQFSILYILKISRLKCQVRAGMSPGANATFQPYLAHPAAA
eukprot:1146260-Pelagomonas_calceolata.AAC.1